MAARKAIYTESFSHKNPIPAACRLGNLVVSGIINGLDPARPDDPGTLAEQCRLMFARLRDIMAAAGGSIDDIAKLNVTLTDLKDRDAVNVEWVAMFPDPATRPARQTYVAELDRGKLVQCDLLGWIGG